MLSGLATDIDDAPTDQAPQTLYDHDPRGDRSFHRRPPSVDSRPISFDHWQLSGAQRRAYPKADNYDDAPQDKAPQEIYNREPRGDRGFHERSGSVESRSLPVTQRSYLSAPPEIRAVPQAVDPRLAYNSNGLAPPRAIPRPSSAGSITPALGRPQTQAPVPAVTPARQVSPVPLGSVPEDTPEEKNLIRLLKVSEPLSHLFHP